jgi:UDP-N-acetylmuramoylalanine--D-glutamate ligase
VGITGSNGKSTTTCLTYEMLKACGHNAWLGGNIGRSLLAEIRNVKPTDIVVLELSSFQLEDLHRLGCSPHISIVVNITPNHLDRHLTMENYIGAKKSIMRYQSERDFLILNHEDTIIRRWADESRAHVYFFSAERELAQGAFVREQELHVRDGRAPVRVTLDRVQLPGKHNLENIAAASMAAHLAGAGAREIDSAVSSFRGLEHRLELVAEVSGVRYYNDSIATTPESAIAALRSFRCGRVLIAGGSEKGVCFDAFAEEAARSAKCVILLGAAAEKLQALIRAHRNGNGLPKILRCNSLRDAIHCAAREAEPGDVVLLSPACASFDMFRNFAERGQQFKALVQELEPCSNHSVV